ncbi:MAG: heavy-metal-associated domain-containing protein [Bacillus subtilis]|nr:heavy-metal-associated domain-containing protein [Bacillus subtilis]
MRKRDGVQTVTVSLLTKSMVVEYDEAKVKPSKTSFSRRQGRRLRRQSNQRSEIQ